MGTKEFKTSSGRKVVNIIKGMVYAGLLGTGLSFMLNNYLQHKGVISRYGTPIETVLIYAVIIIIFLFLFIDIKDTVVTVDEKYLTVRKGSKEKGRYDLDSHFFGSYVVTHRTNGIPTSKDVSLTVFDLDDQQIASIALNGFTPELLSEVLALTKLRVMDDSEELEIPEKRFELASPVKESKHYLSVQVTKEALRINTTDVYDWDGIDYIQMTPPSYNAGIYSGVRELIVSYNGKKKKYNVGPLDGKHAAGEDYSELYSILETIMLKLKGISVGKL